MSAPQEEATLNAATVVSREESGTSDPVKAASVVSTGAVEIHPEHAVGTRKPLSWWLLTSRKWLGGQPPSRMRHHSRDDRTEERRDG
jgi:hypothetical protein